MGASVSVKCLKDIGDDFKIKIVTDLRDIFDHCNDENDFEIFSSIEKRLISLIQNEDRVKSAIKCDILDFEESVEAVFKADKTPIISDTSSDNKVCTFFSYQPDVVLFDAEKMLRNSLTQPIQVLMEDARKHLVNSMKFGKTLGWYFILSFCYFWRYQKR